MSVPDRPSFEARLRNELGLIVTYDEMENRWRLVKPGVDGTYLLDRSWVVERGADHAVRMIRLFFSHVSGERARLA